MTSLGLRCCGTCAYWQRASAIAMAERLPDGSRDDVGACQLSPPAIIRTPEGGWTSVFPGIRAHRFCGAWEPFTDPDGGGEVAPATVVALDDHRRAA